MVVPSLVMAVVAVWFRGGGRSGKGSGMPAPGSRIVALGEWVIRLTVLA